MPHTVPHRTSTKTQIGSAVLALVAIATCWCGARFALRERAPANHSGAQKSSVATFAWAAEYAPNQRPSERLIYPFSLVPGGFQNIAGLKNAIATDPSLAAHYAAFDVSRARMGRLSRDRFAYVSYRVAGHIYWTKKQVRLAKGEAVITDGVHIIRSRCGNLVSEAAASPTSPAEPSVTTLDTPLATPSIPASLASGPADPGLAATQPAETVAPGAASPAAPGAVSPPGGWTGGYALPVVLIPYGGAPSASPAGTSPFSIPPFSIPIVRPPLPPLSPSTPPPPIAVPEPSTAVQLLVSAPLFWFLRRKRRRKLRL
jgi:hypothetical protein